MRERKNSCWSDSLFGWPIRMQVDVNLFSNWSTCLPKLQKKLWRCF